VSSDAAKLYLSQPRTARDPRRTSQPRGCHVHLGSTLLKRRGRQGGHDIRAVVMSSLSRRTGVEWGSRAERLAEQRAKAVPAERGAALGGVAHAAGREVAERPLGDTSDGDNLGWLEETDELF
jgi:hypothetical protein